MTYKHLRGFSPNRAYQNRYDQVQWNRDELSHCTSDDGRHEWGRNLSLCCWECMFCGLTIDGTEKPDEAE